MPAAHVRICLVSSPGAVRNSTLALIASFDDLQLVAVVAGALSATQMLEHLEVDALLIDANVPDGETAALLFWIGDNKPGIYSVVATLTTAQRHEAVAIGASAAIRRDELPYHLQRVLADLSQQVSSRNFARTTNSL